MRVEALKFVLALHDKSEANLIEHLSLLDRLLDLLEARHGAWIGEFAASLEYRLKQNRVRVVMSSATWINDTLLLSC